MHKDLEDFLNRCNYYQVKPLSQTDQDGYVVTTYYLDHLNDAIEFYVLPQTNKQYLVTDDGWLINEIEMMGSSYLQYKEQLNKLQQRHFGIGYQTDSREFTTQLEQPFNQKTKQTLAHYIQFLIEAYALLLK